MKKMVFILSLVLMLTVLMTGLVSAQDVKRVAVILDPVGVNPFLTQVVEKLAEIKESGKYPLEFSVIECADNAAWAENIRASVEEGFDLLLVVGWQGADPLNEVAAQFPDRAQYALIDTVCDNIIVTSSAISFISSIL